jgi:hypothetical protein
LEPSDLFDKYLPARFPHRVKIEGPASPSDRTVGDLAGNEKISNEARRKILWGNPARLYGLEVYTTWASFT